MPRRSPVLFLVLVLTLAACGTGTSISRSPAASQPAAAPEPSVSSLAGRQVFIIVMENKNFSQALSGQYTAELSRRFTLLTDYHAVAHPSLPNYLALTSGSTWNISDDGYHRLPMGGLGQQLTLGRISWRAYMEGMSGTCRQDTGRYAVKHDPFAYYGGSCPPNVVPLSRLSTDLAGSAPRLLWIIPDLCNSTHDCPVANGDRWLGSIVPEIMASAAWSQGGVLFVVWDEAEDSSPSNQVATLVISPTLKPADPQALYDHYSLLATVQDTLGVPRLGQAAQAHAIALAG